MQLPANRCKAIAADTDQTSHCPYRASVSSLFCREHAEELHALEERECTAVRDADRLKPIIDQMLAEGAKVYTRVKEVQKNGLFVRLYLESLEQQIGAAVALRTRFFSEDRGSENLAVLEERKGSVVAFLAALQARAGDIERELELERVQEAEPQTAANPSKDPEPGPKPASPTTPEVLLVPTSTPAAPPNLDEPPPAYPILNVPHPPCACTADSSDNRPDPRARPPDRCIALRLRDGERCTWTCRSGQRFCGIHCVAHATVVIAHKVKEGMLEVQRMRLARGEGDTTRRVRDIKGYVDKLEEMMAILEDHQCLFSCRSPDTHATLLQDFKERRTSACLLLGKLSGRTDVAVAEKQGQAETWATEFLAEVKNKDAIERRKAAEDLLMGAIVGGASAWFGVPWARSAVAGVVSSLVVRRARDTVNKS